MATRKLTLTIPESLAERLDAYPGRLKLSAFLQEKLTEFLDAEEAKAVAVMREQQSLDEKVLVMVMHGHHASAYERGKSEGAAWAKSLNRDQLMDEHARTALNPYPLELGRPDLLPQSLLRDDPRFKAYAETMLGPDVLNSFLSAREPVFMLPSGKRDEALAWISGWNDGLGDVHREQLEFDWMTGGPPEEAPSKPKRGRRKRS